MPETSDRIHPHLPTRVVQVELSEPLPAIAASAGPVAYRTARVLVRLHTIPVGTVELALPESGEASAAQLAQTIWSGLGEALAEHLIADGLEVPTRLGTDGLGVIVRPACLAERATILAHPPRVSIVVATRERVQMLRTCLRSLLELDYPDFEILVVDNAPATDRTQRLVREPEFDGRVGYLLEPRRGLAAAHNCGLGSVSGQVIAFTDDDTTADRFWLLELVRGFRTADRVTCVTGLILPTELETPAQLVADRIWEFNKGFRRRVFDATTRDGDELYPYAAGKFGSGANMAFDTAALRAYGGFDPATGIGTAARGGDDLSVFFTVIASGDRLAYNPSAMLSHTHHREYAALRRQAYSYGVGLTAYLTKTVVDDPARLLELGRLWRYGLRRAVDPRPGPVGPRPGPAGREPRAWPSDLARAERLGMLSGPAAYLWSRVSTALSTRTPRL